MSIYVWMHITIVQTNFNFIVTVITITPAEAEQLQSHKLIAP